MIYWDVIHIKLVWNFLDDEADIKTMFNSYRYCSVVHNWYQNCRNEEIRYECCGNLPIMDTREYRRLRRVLRAHISIYTNLSESLRDVRVRTHVYVSFG